MSDNETPGPAQGAAAMKAGNWPVYLITAAITAIITISMMAASIMSGGFASGGAAPEAGIATSRWT